jgi:hypothetical protein
MDAYVGSFTSAQNALVQDNNTLRLVVLMAVGQQ